MSLDKVRPLKIETTPEGNQSDPFPTEVNPTADYIACKGIAFNDTDTEFIDTDGSGNIEFQDATQTTPITLTDLTLAPNFFFAENTATQSTSSKTAVNALTLTVSTSIPAGQYYILFNFNWSNTATGASTSVTCYYTVAGTQTNVCQFSARPSNAANVQQQSPWKIVTLSNQVANSVVVKMDFFTSANTATVQECRILFYRIQ